MKRAPIAMVFVMLAAPALAVVVAAAMHYFAERPSGALVVAGHTRPYIVHVPPRYDPSKPTPLVLSIHGAVNWPAFQMRLSGWNRLADEEGFIAAYPAGVGGGLAVWNLNGSPPAQMPDVVYVSKLLDKLSAEYNIDPARIYVNGLSNGGGTSFVLSCALSNRIAAAGLVASAFTRPWEWCTDTKPVPMMAFHGTADTYTPYHGAKVWLAPHPFPSVPKFIASWARRNGCAPEPVETPVASKVTKREYTGCAADASVVFYTIKGGGHTWPGGLQLPEWMLGETSREIDATRVLWEFYKQHPLR